MAELTRRDGLRLPWFELQRIDSVGLGTECARVTLFFGEQRALVATQRLAYPQAVLHALSKWWASRWLKGT